MKQKRIKLKRLQYLENNISLLSNMGTEKDEEEYVVEVQNEDGSRNNDMTYDVNRIYMLNVKREELMRKVMGEEYGGED